MGFSEPIRNWITYPTKLAQVNPPVKLDKEMVETPILLSDAGAAITLLNWTGEHLQSVHMKIQVPFAVRHVKSVQHGDLNFEKGQDGITCSLPLEAADILVIQP